MDLEAPERRYLEILAGSMSEGTCVAVLSVPQKLASLQLEAKI